MQTLKKLKSLYRKVSLICLVKRDIFVTRCISFTGSSVVASTSCYLLCRNQWFVLSKMQTPRCRHGLAVTGEFVYAAGGQYREGLFKVLLKLNCVCLVERDALKSSLIH